MTRESNDNLSLDGSECLDEVADRGIWLYIDIEVVRRFEASILRYIYPEAKGEPYKLRTRRGVSHLADPCEVQRTQIGSYLSLV